MNTEMKNVRLPYINNAQAVLITILINIGVVFLFNFPNGIDYQGIILDSLICAIITTIINMWIVYPRLKKMRTAGQIPLQVPVSKLMQKLPKNPFLLGVVCAGVFAALMVGINALIVSFFEIQNISFAPWLVYKLIYSTFLSIKIVEFCIFRYVQPDWLHTKTEENVVEQSVKNPMPKISVFKEMFGAVTTNIAMGIILGSFLGGVSAQADGSVVIAPTTIEGIPITGLIFGLIIGILVTSGIVNAMKKSIRNAELEILEAAVKNRYYTWMPKRKIPLICLVSISVMIFSAIVLPAILALFDKTLLNFYQFVIFITVYAALLSKPISYILIKRCMQPDYISFVLKRKENKL